MYKICLIVIAVCGILIRKYDGFWKNSKTFCDWVAVTGPKKLEEYTKKTKFTNNLASFYGNFILVALFMLVFATVEILDFDWKYVLIFPALTIVSFIGNTYGLDALRYIVQSIKNKIF